MLSDARSRCRRWILTRSTPSSRWRWASWCVRTAPCCSRRRPRARGNRRAMPTNRGGQERRYFSGRCRGRASKERRVAAGAAAGLGREPALEPLPDAIERPFRAPLLGKGGEDPAMAALLASVSRLPWEQASPSRRPPPQRPGRTNGRPRSSGWRAGSATWICAPS